MALSGWYRFGSKADKVAFIRSKCSADTTTWLDSLVPPLASADKVVAAIQSEHEVQDDERSASDRLFALKLKPPYLATSFDNHAAALDKILPLVITIDRVSLRSSFLFTLPPAMKTKLEDMAIVKSMTSSTYVQMKSLGRELWTKGYRPDPPPPVVHVHQLCVQGKSSSRHLSHEESLVLLALNSWETSPVKLTTATAAQGSTMRSQIFSLTVGATQVLEEQEEEEPWHSTLDILYNKTIINKILLLTLTFLYK